MMQASGRVGKHFAEELLNTGKHKVTALTRANSKGTIPDGVAVANVDYDDEESLVSALKGQQFLVVTLPVTAGSDIHSKIVHAAAKAGVPYIMPNAYGSDFLNDSLRDERFATSSSLDYCKEIESLGASYVAMVCGFWFEWSLALGERTFGFDFKNKKVTFFDDGNTRICVSTWRQCGRALAALLSLPEAEVSPSLSQWKNKPLYLASFTLSQRDMLDSINRILGATDNDWQISHQSSAQRYKDGVEEMQKGSNAGFVKAMYTRVFFPSSGGDFAATRGLANETLDLPKEDLDEATKRVLEMVESGWNPFAQ